MYKTILCFIISGILINPFECHRYHRRKLQRRQGPQMAQVPQLQTYSSLQQPVSQFPITNAKLSSSSSFSRLPPGNSRLSYEIPSIISSDNAIASFSTVGLPYNNIATSDNIRTFDNIATSPDNIELPYSKSIMYRDNLAVPSDNNNLWSVSASAMSFLSSSTPSGETGSTFNFESPSVNRQESMPLVQLDSNFGESDFDPINADTRRRKKNIEEKNDKLNDVFEEENELSEMLTENYPSSSTDYIQYDNDHQNDVIISRDAPQAPKNTTLKPEKVFLPFSQSAVSPIDSSTMSDKTESTFSTFENYQESTSLFTSYSDSSSGISGSSAKEKDFQEDNDNLVDFSGKEVSKVSTESYLLSSTDFMEHKHDSNRDVTVSDNMSPSFQNTIFENETNNISPFPKFLASSQSSSNFITETGSISTSVSRSFIDYQESTSSMSFYSDYSTGNASSRYKKETIQEKDDKLLKHIKNEKKMPKMSEENSFSSSTDSTDYDNYYDSDNAISSNVPSLHQSITMEHKEKRFVPFPKSVLPTLSSSTSNDETEFTSTGSESSADDQESISLITSYSDSSPMTSGSRNRKENIDESSGKLMEFFEKGKKLLEVSSEKYLLNTSDLMKYDDESIENGDLDRNTTLIPISKGVQLKTVSKNNGSIVHSSVNISSSTQKIISFDNNTEIENVVEMQMEKKIEDEKGADKGFEEVRIVETERVKPMFRWNAPKVHKRRKKNHKFQAHHRSKRSDISSNEIPRSKFLYNKMAHRFLSVVRRKERVVEPKNLLNQRVISGLPETDQKVTTEKAERKREASIYDKKEIKDFMNFFLKQLKKFRKSQELKNNKSELMKTSYNRCNKNILPNKIKKLKQRIPYPEHVNVIMNLNMTWDSKFKNHVSKSVNISKKERSVVKSFVNTTTSNELKSQLKKMTPVKNVSEEQNRRLLRVVLSFSTLTCIFTVSTLILPKLCKFIRLKRMNSGVKSYKLYEDYLRTKDKGDESENLCADVYSPLKWQSENGDWLSDKESEFK